ncbi:hypothetical protein GY45DRAFT_673314 [Cubamyces sp. BRFM 1775]|nr:hypothetical protein GY45DRAFT_673314 [Cubamyces sp. BRFM 1775]
MKRRGNHRAPKKPVASSSREDVLRAALLASASGSSFEDVKFFVFSRRNREGLVDKPMPVLANSTLLRKASSHFDYLFTQGYAESGIVDIDAPYPSTRPDKTTDYDYECDSDLEDEEEWSEPDIVLEDASDTAVGSSPNPEPSKDGDDSDSKGDSGDGDAAAPTTNLTRPGRQGRVVFLDGIAHKTWRAFVIFTYLGPEELTFAPLRSEGKSRSPVPGLNKTPACSPKSIYRLAERYDIPSLKELAADEIKKRLSPHNILEEIFSTFPSLYPDVQDIELEYLQAHLHEPVVQDRLPVWIESLAKGELPTGSERVISNLLKRGNSANNSKRCPGGCSTGYYISHCNACGRNF